jgi:hypothetical protein
MPKQAFYAFKRLAKDVVGSVVKGENSYELYVSNDSDKATPVSITARVLGSDKSAKLSVIAKAYSAKKVALPFELSDRDVVICDLEYLGNKDRCFYKDTDLAITRADDKLCVVERREDSITLKASAYIHAIELEGEYMLEDNCFSMLEGEMRTVNMRSLSENKALDVRAYTLK